MKQYLMFLLMLTIWAQARAGVIQVKREERSLDVSNGSEASCSNVEILRGRDGRDGDSGRDGRDGLPGAQGPQGPKGEPGPAGPPGQPGARGATGLKGDIGPAGPRSGGVTYTRWGKSSCPTIAGTELVYSGRAGGTHSQYTGGAANYLCMPLDPEYTLPYQAAVRHHNFVFGAEYEHPILGTHQHNVPCAVCAVSTREMVLMIPAKTSCPTSWTREYYGYLMSDFFRSHSRSMFTCVDRDQESLPESHANTDGALLRPAAMVWLALLMIPRKSLHVLFAQSEVNLNHTTLDSAVYIIIIDWIAIMY